MQNQSHTHLRQRHPVYTHLPEDDLREAADVPAVQLVGQFYIVARSAKYKYNALLVMK